MDNADRGMIDLAIIFSQIYKSARRDSDAEANKYLIAFAALDLLMRKRLKKKEITESDYKAWKQREVFSSDKWKKSREKISNIYLTANKKANRAVEAKRINVFANSANRTLYNFESQTGISTPIPLHNEDSVKKLQKDDPKKLPPRKVNGRRDIAWNDKNVQNAVTQSIIEGESVQECAKRIADITGNTNEKAMLRYARTAMCGAQSAGALESLYEQQAMGINVQKRWVATLDGKTRDSHRHLDGQTKDLDEPFISLLGNIQYPGDPEAKAGDIFNCRCAIEAYYPEYKDIVKRDRLDNETRQMVGDVTYEEWKEQKRLQSVHFDDIIYTKARSDELPPPMDAERFRKMRESLQKQGIRVQQAITDDDVRYMNYIGAEAVTQWPDQIMYVGGDVPSASAMFEECIHIGQYNLYGEDAMMKHHTLMEAVANKKMLDHADEYGFTPLDKISVEKNYHFWLERLQKEGGSIDDINDIPIIQNKRR